MTTTTRRPRTHEQPATPSVDRDPRLEGTGDVLPNGNPVIPVPPSSHPAAELVHPWTD